MLVLLGHRLITSFPEYAARHEPMRAIDRMLDHIALLFARVKTQNKKTPKHVTAAGLIKDKTVWYVCITKNDGFDGLDREFGRELEQWLALSVNEDRDSGLENDLWQRLLSFWGDRIEFYTECAKNIDWENQIGDKKSDIVEHFRDVMRDFEEVFFDEEWDQVPIMLEQAKNMGWQEVSEIHKQDRRKTQGKVPDNCRRKMTNESQQYLENFYDFWSRPKRHQYPPSSPGESAANNYSKCVYYLDMLSMPMSIWKAMVRFRDLKKENTIRVILVEKPILVASGGKLNKSAVAEVLKDMKDKNITDTTKALKAVQASPDRTQNIYLHCELQMLMLFHQVKDQSQRTKHPFIGCSKLSCWLCWYILGKQRYKTRGTHGTISANWDFPFPKCLDNTVDSFLELRSTWEDLFSANKNGQFPQWPPVRNTDPASTNRNNYSEVSTSAEISTYLLTKINFRKTREDNWSNWGFKNTTSLVMNVHGDDFRVNSHEKEHLLASILLITRIRMIALIVLSL